MGALAGQAFLSLHAPLRAWPEVLVPSYLMGKGWRLYREIKFVHTPLFISALAAFFRAAGYSDLTLRLAALAPALAAQVGIWSAGRSLGWRLPARGASALFLAVYLSLWDANAIWPEVLMAAFSVPLLLILARDGERGSETMAGAVFGLLLLVKQTALFAALAAGVWLLRRKPRRIAAFLLPLAAFPLAAFGFFALLGDGAPYWRWTVAVPLFGLKGKIDLAPRASQLLFAAPAVLPLLPWLAAPRHNGRTGRAPVVLLVLGFGAMAFPRFEFVHLAATVPILAYAAGAGLAEAAPGAGRWMAPAAVFVALGIGAAQLAAGSSTGVMTFWRSPDEDHAVEWLRRQPEAPLFLHGPEQNLYIRAGRVPPGRLYCNPGLWYLYLAEDLEQRQIEALRAHRETIVLEGAPFPPAGAGGRLAEILRRDYLPAPGPGRGFVRLVPTR